MMRMTTESMSDNHTHQVVHAVTTGSEEKKDTPVSGAESVPIILTAASTMAVRAYQYHVMVQDDPVDSWSRRGLPEIWLDTPHQLCVNYAGASMFAECELHIFASSVPRVDLIKCTPIDLPLDFVARLVSLKEQMDVLDRLKSTLVPDVLRWLPWQVSDDDDDNEDDDGGHHPEAQLVAKE
jgi:hypothetical protein